MPSRCVVFGCSNIPDTKNCIALHSIPFHGDPRPEAIKRRKIWVDFVKRKNGSLRVQVAYYAQSISNRMLFSVNRIRSGKINRIFRGWRKTMSVFATFQQFSLKATKGQTVKENRNEKERFAVRWDNLHIYLYDDKFSLQRLFMLQNTSVDRSGPQQKKQLQQSQIGLF